MTTYNTDRGGPEPPPLFHPSTFDTYTPNSHTTNTTNDDHSRTTRFSPSSMPPLSTLQDPSNWSSFSSATSRLTDKGLAVLNRIKDSLPESMQPWFWLGLWFGVAVLIIGLAIGFSSNIFAFLEAIATFIKGLGPFGPPVLMIYLFATSFPPVIGYSSVVTMSGYVYGFVYGFAITFIAALAGSIVCFYLCRRWFKGQVRKLMAKNESLKAVVRTVERRGFRLLVLIRLAPYPYNIMNALLSATHVPLSTFTLATAISLVKLALHVYIGSTLSTFAGHDGDDGEKDPQAERGRKVKIVVMFFSIVLGIGVGAYVWLVAKREIAITEALRIERRRRKRSRRAQSELGRGSSGSIGHGREGARHPGYELSSNINSQNGIPGVDLTNGSSYEGLFDSVTGRWEGALPASSGSVGKRYRDDEDEHDDGQEGQSLFGQGQQQVQQHGDWRNVGVNVDSSTDESDESDFLDNEDDDEEEGGMGGRELPMHQQGEEEEEEEALDFSAHHVGLAVSPWQDEYEYGNEDLDGSEHVPVVASSNRVTNSRA